MKVFSPKRKIKSKKVKGVTRGTRKADEPKKKVVLLLVSSFFGIFGADRIYSGQIVLGLLKLVTFGGGGYMAFNRLS